MEEGEIIALLVVGIAILLMIMHSRKDPTSDSSDSDASTTPPTDTATATNITPNPDDEHFVIFLDESGGLNERARRGEISFVASGIPTRCPKCHSRKIRRKGQSTWECECEHTWDDEIRI